MSFLVAQSHTGKREHQRSHEPVCGAHVTAGPTANHCHTVFCHNSDSLNQHLTVYLEGTTPSSILTTADPACFFVTLFS